MELDPRNADASTDLGVSYYYSNRPDQALAQFEKSLAIDPAHTKTLLNKGIVLAFGKQDLQAAAAEWQRVVELAPDSPEGQAARRALDGIASGHRNEGAGTGSP
jgi:tetratricopeptide (TPR) repeat protein